MKLRKLGEVLLKSVAMVNFCVEHHSISRNASPVAETEAFLRDTSPNKRDTKIEELLERPGYAAWWATKLCDWT